MENDTEVYSNDIDVNEYDDYDIEDYLEDESLSGSEASVEEDEENECDNDEQDENDGDAICDDDIQVTDTASSVSLKRTGHSIIRNRLTKYEYTRVFSLRVTQIQNGAFPLVQVERNMSVEDIVKKEFDEGRIPIIIERTLPKEKGASRETREYKKLNELFNVVMH